MSKNWVEDIRLEDEGMLTILDGEGEHTFWLHTGTLISFYRQVRDELDGYIGEMEAARREFERGLTPPQVEEEMREAYAVDDPKHPDFYDNAVAAAERLKDRERGL